MGLLHLIGVSPRSPACCHLSSKVQLPCVLFLWILLHIVVKQPVLLPKALRLLLKRLSHGFLDIHRYQTRYGHITFFPFSRFFSQRRKGRGSLRQLKFSLFIDFFNNIADKPTSFSHDESGMCSVSECADFKTLVEKTYGWPVVPMASLWSLKRRIIHPSVWGCSNGFQFESARLKTCKLTLEMVSALQYAWTLQLA